MDQVLRGFQADRQADEVGGDADALLGLGGGPLVHGGTGVAHQRLDPAEADGVGEQLEVLQESTGDGLIAPDFEGDHAAKVTHLALGGGVAGVGGEAGVVDRLDRRVLAEEGGHLQGVGAVLAHAELEGFEAAQGEPAAERVGGGPEALLIQAQLGAEGLVVGHDGSGENVGVAANVLGDAVEDDVDSLGQRGLQGGGGEGVVDAGDQFVGFGELGEAGHVEYFETRVGDAFPIKEAGVGAQGVLEGLVILKVDEGELDLEVFHDFLKQFGGAAVNALFGNDVVAGFDDGEQDAADSPHARAEGHGVAGPFQVAEEFFQGVDGGVTHAGVEIAVAVGHVGAVEGEGAHLIQGRDDCPGSWAGGLVAVDGVGLKRAVVGGCGGCHDRQASS